MVLNGRARDMGHAAIAAVGAAILATPLLVNGSGFAAPHDHDAEVAVLLALTGIAGLVGAKRGAVAGCVVATLLTVAATASLPGPAGGSDSSGFHFAGIAIAVAVVAWRVYLSWRIVLPVVAFLALSAAFFGNGVYTALAVAVAAALTQILLTFFGWIAVEVSQVLRSVNRRWTPVLAYLGLAAGCVTVFGLWFRAVYLHWPAAAFELKTGVELTLGLSLYQSLLVFATVGPPFAPLHPLARAVVALELIASILLATLYLGLVIRSLDQN